MSQPGLEEALPRGRNEDLSLGDNEGPLITTIIPTYRRPRHLRRAVKSVLSQTYSHFQVCVYDNASGDETEAVVAELSENDTRVKYYCHDRNIGPLKNFNFGLGRVNTALFSLLSDDDVILPDFFQSAVTELERHPDAAFYSGATIMMTEDGKVRYAPSKWPSEGYQAPPEGMFTMIQNRLTWTSILFRRDVLEVVRELDAKVGAPSDLDFLLRIAARFPFVVSSKPAAIFLDHPGSHSSVIDLDYTWPAQLHMIRNITGETRIPIETRERAERVLTEDLIGRLFFVGGNCIRIKKFGDAYEIARILREQYGLKRRAAILSATAWICERMPFVHTAFLGLNHVRKLAKYPRAVSLQTRFGKYARYLLDE